MDLDRYSGGDSKCLIEKFIGGRGREGKGAQEKYFFNIKLILWV
jgi:hypothetical protein